MVKMPPCEAVWIPQPWFRNRRLWRSCTVAIRDPGEAHMGQKRYLVMLCYTASLYKAFTLLTREPM